MLAFVHIEKTAGMTVHQLLKRSFGTRFVTAELWTHRGEFLSARDVQKLRRLYPQLDCLGSHWIKPWTDVAEALPGARWWTFLREPLARCASAHQYRIQVENDRRSLEEWLSVERQRNFQCKKLCGSDDPKAAIRMLEQRFCFVGLTERFDESLVMLKRFAEEPNLKIRYRSENVASDNSIKRRLLEDPDARSRMEAANQADLELYRWVREELYPRQQEKYGPRLADDVAEFQSHNDPPRLDPRLVLSELKRYGLYKPWLFLSRGRRS